MVIAQLALANAHSSGPFAGTITTLSHPDRPQPFGFGCISPVWVSYPLAEGESALVDDALFSELIRRCKGRQKDIDGVVDDFCACYRVPRYEVVAKYLTFVHDGPGTLQ